MTHSQSEKQKQRRRGILKAVAGVPVIFTIPTGAAVAATSITCVDKSGALARDTQPLGATTSAGSADTWVRYKVERMTIKVVSPGDTLDNAFSIAGIWYQVSANGVVSKVTATLNTGFTPTGFNPKQYYYLLVDHTKYMNFSSPESFVYLGTENTVGAPIAGASCWNSVTPSASLSTNILN